MGNADTDDVANRRAQLRRWIREHCDNKQAVFVERSGINQGELSALLKNKSFGEKRARSLERAAGMPLKYLDQRGDSGYAQTVASRADAREATPSYAAWPFARITPHQYDRLSVTEKLAVEQIVALFVARAGVASTASNALAHTVA